MENRTFEVRQEHIKLIKNMCVSWNDSCFGSPTVDSKRPYGTTLVLERMAEILDMELKDEEEDSLSDSQIECLMKLHKETETVLEILLYNCSLEVGIYINKGYANEWTLIKD